MKYRRMLSGMLNAFRKDMKWLEEIRLRSQPSRDDEITKALLEIVDSLQGSKGLESARAYTHQARPGGFSLILEWNTTSAPTQGSDTAIMILEGLKPLGLIDHTVMIGKK